jgi:antitoxin component HigA of HigAB toxin-antitoxin module
MLVVDKTHRIEVEVTGKGAEFIVSLIKEHFPEADVFSDDDEPVVWKDSDLAKEIKAGKTPGKVLRAYRERAGMSIVELSRAAGTKYPNISAMENDRRAIGLAMAKKLAKILKTEYTKFID